MKKVGQGASGSVYLARRRQRRHATINRTTSNSGTDSSDDAPVAIKQMDLAAQPRKDLIVNEILIMREFRHDNIVNFLDAFLVTPPPPSSNPSPQQSRALIPPHLWIVMEYMDGGALTSIIEHNTLRESHMARILQETLSGLSHLHSMKIIHRDIKSDNVLLDFEGRVKIIDFGYCAKLTEGRGKRAKLVGT